MRRLRILGALVAVIALTGCTAAQVGPVSRSPALNGAAKAAGDWRSWAPVAAGALLWAAPGLDDDLSDAVAGDPDEDALGSASRARRYRDGRGLIGDRRTAGVASDVLWAGSYALWMLPGWCDCRAADGCRCGLSPASRLRLGLATSVASAGFTELGKRGIGRERPNGIDTKSMPSGHTSLTATNCALARYEVQRSPTLTAAQKRHLDAILTVYPAVTGYLRVEAKQHYLSDTLVGYGLGNFLGTYANEAFLVPRYRSSARPSVLARRTAEGMDWGLGIGLDL